MTNISITFLPDSYASRLPTRPFVFLHHTVPTDTVCSCEEIGVGDAAQWYGNVAALVFPCPPHAAAWGFSRAEAPGLTNITISIHDACVDNESVKAKAL